MYLVLSPTYHIKNPIVQKNLTGMRATMNQAERHKFQEEIKWSSKEFFTLKGHTLGCQISLSLNECTLTCLGAGSCLLCDHTEKMYSEAEQRDSVSFAKSSSLLRKDDAWLEDIFHFMGSLYKRTFHSYHSWAQLEIRDMMLDWLSSSNKIYPSICKKQITAEKTEEALLR